jgi:hypothetical protein
MHQHHGGRVTWNRLRIVGAALPTERLSPRKHDRRRLHLLPPGSQPLPEAGWRGRITPIDPRREGKLQSQHHSMTGDEQERPDECPAGTVREKHGQPHEGCTQCHAHQPLLKAGQGRPLARSESALVFGRYGPVDRHGANYRMPRQSISGPPVLSP